MADADERRLADLAPGTSDHMRDAGDDRKTLLEREFLVFRQAPEVHDRPMYPQ